MKIKKCLYCNVKLTYSNTSCSSMVKQQCHTCENEIINARTNGTYCKECNQIHKKKDMQQKGICICCYDIHCRE